MGATLTKTIKSASLVFFVFQIVGCRTMMSSSCGQEISCQDLASIPAPDLDIDYVVDPNAPALPRLLASEQISSESSVVHVENKGVVNTVVPVKEDLKPSQEFIGSGPEVRYIKADQLYIRSEPNRFSNSIGLVHGGDEVHVQIQGDWAKLDEGRWIRSRWLVKKRPNRFITPPSVSPHVDQRLSAVK
jgi:hypothetical protein